MTRRLRADDATRGIKMILLTARVQDADVERGFDAGADDDMRKPFSPQELRARVQALLDWSLRPERGATRDRRDRPRCCGAPF